MSFFPYVMAGNKNELHDSKKEFALQNYLISHRKCNSMRLLLGMESCSGQILQQSKGPDVSCENCGLFLSGVKTRIFPLTLSKSNKWHIMLLLWKC